MVLQILAVCHAGHFSSLLVVATATDNTATSTSRGFQASAQDLRDAPVSPVDYYGQLVIPHEYHFLSKANGELNMAQPGAVVLTDGEHLYRSTVKADGSFIVKNLRFGSYLLQADWFEFVFPTVRVDVQWKRTSMNGTRVEITTYRNEYPVRAVPGSGLDEESAAVIVTVGAVNYYEPRQKIDIMKIVKSPMGLMCLVGVSMMLMMKMIPEEELKKAQAESKAMKKKIAASALEGISSNEVATRGKKKTQ